MALEFEQQTHESDKAFAAFTLYLGMGAQRSAQAVAGQLGKSEQLMRRWAARHRWTERVAAYGAHMAGVARQAQELAVRAKAGEWLRRQTDVREREWEMHEKCIAAARRGLAAFEAREKVYANLADISRMLEVASKLGRMASGLATESVEHTGEVDVNFRLEVEAAIKKVYGQAEPAPTHAEAAPVIDVEALPEVKRELV